MRVYDARDDACAGIGLGSCMPETADVQEDAGGEYVLRLSVPVAEGSGWELLQMERQLSALCPVLDGVKPQRFRIHAISVGDSGGHLEVQARHISYDLQYILTNTGKTSDVKVSVRKAGESIWQGIQDGAQGFTLEVTAEGEATSGWGQCSVTKALLDQSGGLVRTARARLVRDNKRILLMPGDGLDSGVTIRYGRNLLSLAADEDSTECYTRLIPTGLDEEGNPLYLPEKQIDSPRIGDYALPRVCTWQVTGARVGQKSGQLSGKETELTREDVYRMLREDAQERLDRGCDRPLRSGTVEAVGLEAEGETPPDVRSIRLYEQVQVVHGPLGLRMREMVSGYVWDALLLRYKTLRLGDPWEDGGKNSFVTASQAAESNSRYSSSSSHTETRLQDMAQYVLEQTEFNNAVLIELNAIDGRIGLLATSTQVEALGMTINTVQAELDAVNARLALKVNSDVFEETKTSVNAAWVELDGLAASIDLMATRTELTALTQRVSQAEIDIDGAQAEILLKASREEMSVLSGGLDAATTRLTQAEIDIDGAQAEILLKADAKIVDGMKSRLTQAEIDIDGMDAKISLKAESTVTDELGETIRQALIEIDGLESEILLKADTILLEGYVKADELETGILSVVDSAFIGERLDAYDITCSSLSTVDVWCAEVHADGATLEYINASGDVSVGGLTIGGEPGATQTWVNEESRAARAVQAMSVADNKLTITLFDGTSVNFSKPASASVVPLAQTWSGGRLTLSTTAEGITLSGQTTASVNSSPENVAWNDSKNKASFDVTSDRGKIIGMSLDATTSYNAGWNACRDACSSVSTAYYISEQADGTLYKKISSGGETYYTGAGSDWVKVKRYQGTLYYRPDAK